MTEMPTIPPVKGKPPAQQRNLWLIAIPVVLVVAVLMGFLIYKIAHKPQGALPTTVAETTDLPAPQPLPAVKESTEPAPAALPEVKKPEGTQAPVVEAAPPKPPENKGTITWRWALYPVNAQILGVPLEATPGYQFAALGVTIYNQSNASVAVDHNAFRVNVDGRVYAAELISSAITFQQMPFLIAATLQPDANMAGCIGYMIPVQYRTVVAEWQVIVPPGIKVVRVDPTGTPQPPTANTGRTTPRGAASGDNGE
jgi:hypothetical protein